MTAFGRLHSGVSTNWRIAAVSRRWSSSGMPSSWKRSAGPPRSRARSARPAARPPPALCPITPRRAGSTPSARGLVREPDERGVAVLDAGRERVLGSETVLDRHHHGARRVGGAERARMLELDRAEAEAAAVDVDDARPQRAVAALRHVDAHGERAMVGRAGDHAVLAAHALRGGLRRGGQLREHLQHHEPRGGHVGPVGRDRQQGNDRSDLGIVGARRHESAA